MMSAIENKAEEEEERTARRPFSNTTVKRKAARSQDTRYEQTPTHSTTKMFSTKWPTHLPDRPCCRIRRNHHLEVHPVRLVLLLGLSARLPGQAQVRPVRSLLLRKARGRLCPEDLSLDQTWEL